MSRLEDELTKLQNDIIEYQKNINDLQKDLKDLNEKTKKFSKHFKLYNKTDIRKENKENIVINKNNKIHFCTYTNLYFLNVIKDILKGV